MPVDTNLPKLCDSVSKISKISKDDILLESTLIKLKVPGPYVWSNTNQTIIHFVSRDLSKILRVAIFQDS